MKSRKVSVGSLFGIVAAISLCVSVTHAAQILSNDFSTAGALTANGWTAYSGADASITSDGSVASIGGGAEDVSTGFADQTTNPTYGAILLNASSLPASGTEYSFGLIDGTSMESRYGISVTGGGATFRLTAHAGGSTVLGTSTVDLSLSNDYNVVFYFDGVDDHRLWVDPGSSDFASPDIQVTGAESGIDGFFIRQAGALDNGASDWSIDNLIIADSFSDVATGASVVSTDVTFTASADAVDEDVGTYVVTVVKSLAEGNVSGEITLAGSATEGALDDYTIDTTNFVMNGATTSATFTITVNDDADSEPAETIELALANVVGGTIASPSTFTLTINLSDAAPSSLIISQYTETDSGTTPKGIELWNVSGGDITFDGSSNKLEVYKGVNGAALGLDVEVTNGTVTAGDVFVIGTADLSPDVEYGFTYNGDDALQIQLGGFIQDTFGDPGTGDPGAGWDGNGVQTYDQNIELLDGITDGDLDGWTDPSTRFTNIAVGSSTTGFGVAPGSSPPTNVQFTASSDAVAEDAGTYDITVIKTLDSGNITAEIALSGDATEGGGNDYTVSTTNITLSGATTQQVITVTINDDGDQENGEDIVLTLVNVAGGSLGNPDAFTLTIAGSDLPAPSVWINEVNYDESASPDTNEFVEVAGPAGTDLSDFVLLLYNGNGGAEYDSIALSGSIDDEGCGIGAVDFATPGAQQGPDGIALVSIAGGTTTLVQFVTYEGTFAAVGGPADGFIGENIGTQAASDDTLQLSGTGDAYSEFTWGSAAASQGSLNAGQTIDPCGGGGSTTLDEYDVLGLSESAGSFTVTIDVSSNGVPYTLIYSTNLLTDGPPNGTGTADTQAGDGGPIQLQDTTPADASRAYWIRSNN